MFDIIYNFYRSSMFVELVVMITLVGFLAYVFSLVNRNKKEVLILLFFAIGIVIITIFDSYRMYFDVFSLSLRYTMLSFKLLMFVYWFWMAYIFWNKMSKALFFILTVFGLVITIFEYFFSSSENLLVILNAISIFGSTVFYYFFVMYLIVKLFKKNCLS